MSAAMASSSIGGISIIILSLAILSCKNQHAPLDASSQHKATLFARGSMCKLQKPHHNPNTSRVKRSMSVNTGIQYQSLTPHPRMRQVMTASTAARWSVSVVIVIIITMIIITSSSSASASASLHPNLHLCSSSSSSASTCPIAKQQRQQHSLSHPRAMKTTQFESFHFLTCDQSTSHASRVTRYASHITSHTLCIKPYSPHPHLPHLTPP